MNGYRWVRCPVNQEGCGVPRYLATFDRCPNCDGPLRPLTVQPPAPFLPDVERVATEFARELREVLTAGELIEVNALNKIERRLPGSGICHSHDFCDPNQAMLDAWVTVTGRDLELHSDREMALVNRAWDLAKEKEFWASLNTKKP